jgi:hypothetical protein
MSKKKVQVNKTLEIRRVARQMVLEGKPPRPIEIIARLKAKGIKAVSANVSTALHGTEFAFRQSRTNWERMPPAESLPPLEDVHKAQEFVRNVGSLEKAMAAIVAFGLFKQKPEPEIEEYYGGA